MASSPRSLTSLQKMFLEYQKEKLTCGTKFNVNIFYNTIWNSMEKTLEEKQIESNIKNNICALEKKATQLTAKHYEMCEDRPANRQNHHKDDTICSASLFRYNNSLYLLLIESGFFQSLPSDNNAEIEYLFSQWPNEPLTPIRVTKQDATSVAFLSDERNEDGHVSFFHYVDYNENGKQPKKLSGHFVNEKTCNVVNKGINRFFAYQPVSLSERDEIVKDLEIYSHRKLWKRSLFKREVLKNLFEKSDQTHKNETIYRAFKVYLETLLTTTLLESDPTRSRDVASIAKDINGYLSERVFDRFEKYLPDKSPLEDFCFGYPMSTVFSPGSMLLTHSKFTNIYFSFRSYLSFNEEARALQPNLRNDEIRIRYENENKSVTELLLLLIEDTDIANHWKANYVSIPEEKDNRLPAACWILYNYKLWSEYMVKNAFAFETKKYVTSDRMRFVKEIDTLANYLTECVQILTSNSSSSWW